MTPRKKCPEPMTLITPSLEPMTPELIHICDITIPEQKSGFTLEDIKKIE
jgi:hypothetical protein